MSDPTLRADKPEAERRLVEWNSQLNYGAGRYEMAVKATDYDALRLSLTAAESSLRVTKLALDGAMIERNRALEDIAGVRLALTARDELLREAGETIAHLSDQQAMRDDFYQGTLDRIREALK